jgi:uncharacterized protein Yka (UPF0111/DUF47 family)
MTIIQLLDGSTKYILDNKDFSDLIYEKLGYEAEHEFNNIIEDLQEKADYTKQKVNTDLLSYETSLDQNTAAFNEIQNWLEKIQNMIDNSINRKELAKIVDCCMKEISNCI